MKRILKYITLLSILTIFGIIFCLGEIIILFFSKDQGELSIGVLALWALGLFIIFLIDRFIIKKASRKEVFIIEIIFLILLPFVYLYLNKDTKIYVDTKKSYFIIVYQDGGLTKKTNSIGWTL